MISRLEAKDLLRHIGTLPDEDIDLAEAALALAALDHSDVSLDRYRDHLSLLAREVAELKARGVEFEDYDMPEGSKSASGVLTARGAKAAWFKDSEGNIMAIIQDATQ